MRDLYLNQDFVLSFSVPRESHFFITLLHIFVCKFAWNWQKDFFKRVFSRITLFIYLQIDVSIYVFIIENVVEILILLTF